MEWMNAVFSPTGTTEKVAAAIAEGAGAPVVRVDLSAPVAEQSVTENTLLLAAAPVYGGRIPGTALERLAALKGNGGPAVAVAVYGNRHYDDALLELKDSLEQNGFRVIAAGAFVAEHSIVRSIAAGRPDADDLAEARAFGAAIATKGELNGVSVPGNPEYKAYTPSPAHPVGDESCVTCGLCAAKCPVSAIPPEAPRTTGASCINCMRCVAICPQKCRAMPAAAVEASRAKLSVVAAQPRKNETYL